MCSAARPRLGVERHLGVERRGDRVGGEPEHGHRRVALALLERPNTTVAGDQLVEQVVVAGHGGAGRGLVGLPRPRRADDVGQHERHRPGRQDAAQFRHDASRAVSARTRGP